MFLGLGNKTFTIWIEPWQRSNVPTTLMKCIFFKFQGGTVIVQQPVAYTTTTTAGGQYPAGVVQYPAGHYPASAPHQGGALPPKVWRFHSNDGHSKAVFTSNNIHLTVKQFSLHQLISIFYSHQTLSVDRLDWTFQCHGCLSKSWNFSAQTLKLPKP